MSLFEKKNIIPPKRWGSLEHFDDAIMHPWYQLLFDLSSTIAFSTYLFFQKKKYAVALPPITCNAVTSPMGLGSDSLPVKINLFEEPTYLADSMQFHLEYLLRHRKKGVFYIMPSFRGEEPDCRHLNQFFHIEAEITGTLSDVMACINEYLFYILEQVYQKYYDEIIKINGNMKHIELFLKNKNPAIIHFKDAIKILDNDMQFFSFHEKEIVGLNHLGEKTLMERIGEAIWLSHLPRIGVPFYQANVSDDPHSALAADFLAGIGEIIGCGERHIHAPDLINAMKEREVSPSEYEWYIQLKKDYPLQTSGFGIGLERLLLWILKHDDIRDIPIIQRMKNKMSYP
jgi:aspartyl/asparaginyl-tRNA synthetase